MDRKKPQGSARSRAWRLDPAITRAIEDRVRAAFAWHIAHCAFLPPSLAAALARDVDSGTAAGTADQALAGLSPSAAEPIVATAADGLLGRLVERHGIPRHLAAEIALHGREHALLSLLDGREEGGDIEALAAGLGAANRLTPTLILRALAEGRTLFAHTALAHRAQLPRDEAAHLLQDLRGAGVGAVCRRAGIPVGLLPAFRAASAALAEAGAERGPGWRRELARLLVAKVVMVYDDVAPTNLEHMMSQLSHRLAPAGEERHYQARGVQVH